MSADDAFRDLDGPLRSLVAELYARGYREGAAAMRDSILRAADIPLDGLQPTSISDSASTPEMTQGERIARKIRVMTAAGRDQIERARAPHGAVSTAVELVLKENPGLPMKEIISRVIELDDRISPSSVGTELRRYDTDRYHQDGNGSWFLGGKPPMEKEEPTNKADSSLPNPMSEWR